MRRSMPCRKGLAQALQQLPELARRDLDLRLADAQENPLAHSEPSFSLATTR